MLLIKDVVKVSAFLGDLTLKDSMICYERYNWGFLSSYKIYKHLQVLMSTLCPLKEISMCLKYHHAEKSMGMVFGLREAVCAFCGK